jgi:hypothetical protein
MKLCISQNAVTFLTSWATIRFSRTNVCNIQYNLIYTTGSHCVNLVAVFRLKHDVPLNIIATYRPIARQRLGKLIPARANARSNRTFSARHRISKHASLRIEAVFSAWSVQSGYKEVFSSMKRSKESSFGTPACRDMNLGAEELNWVGSSELAVAE